MVIGIGNDYRSDDGIGLLAARKIRKKNIPNIAVKEESGDGAALIDAWDGFDKVVIIDAVSSGAKPGTMFRIDAEKNTVPVNIFHSSTHTFSLAEAIELARTLNKLPKKLVIYGIEGANFRSGENITPVVAKRGENLIKTILKEIKSHKNEKG